MVSAMYIYTRNLKIKYKMTNQKLTAKEIKSLPRTVIFDIRPDQYWAGKSDGIIHEGLYIKVYPARSFISGYGQYKKTDSINVPLSRVYNF